MVDDEKNKPIIIVKPAEGEKCQRCWRFSTSVGIHEYWPTWRICDRCVRALIEMRTPPFIARSESDFYICKDESEWWDIKSGRKPLPKEDRPVS